MKYTKEDLKAGMVFKAKTQRKGDKGYIIVNPCSSSQRVEFDSLDIPASTWRDSSGYKIEEVLTLLNTEKWIIVNPPTLENPSYEIF